MRLILMMVGMFVLAGVAEAQTGGMVARGVITTEDEFVEIDTRNAVSVVIHVVSSDFTNDTLTVEGCVDSEFTENCTWFVVAGSTLGTTPTAASTFTANGQLRVTNYGYRALRVFGTTIDGGPTITITAYRGLGS